MYAVIRTGGKQERVAEGQRLDVELLRAGEGDDVGFDPVLLVDDGRVTAGPALAGARVSARVVGLAKGPKVRGFTYQSKTRARRRWGHRQRYTTIEITGITGPGRAPADQTPVADARTPVADAPVADAPVAGAPVADAPVAGAPVADAPPDEVPAGDSPATAAGS